MEKRILSALYSGNLILGEHCTPDSDEYKKLLLELDYKRTLLTPYEEKKLDELLNIHTQALSYEVEEAFYRGFSAGILLMQEVQSITF